jgi:hypothetical protein
MSQSKQFVTPDNFDINSFRISDFVPSNKKFGDTQLVSFIRYIYSGATTENNFIFCLPEVTLSTYGIPKLGQYFPEDSKRNFLKYPIDPEQENCAKIANMFGSIDDYAQTNKDELLGEKAAKRYEYSHIVKEPVSNEAETDEDDDENKQKNKNVDKKIKYIKMKFDTDYTTGDLKTVVFNKNENEAPEKLSVKNMTELEQYMPYASTKVKIIGMLSKFWANKNKIGTAPNKIYGFSIKIIQMQVTSTNRSNNISSFSSYLFDDDTPASNTSNTSNNQIKNKKEVEDETNEEEDVEEEEEDEEEEEEEEEEVKEVVTKNPKSKKR